MTNALSGTTVYLDTSALVKRYVTETGSSWTIALCHLPAGNTIATARITNNVLTQAQLSTPVFVAADDNLLKAAQAEGLNIENPNLYL
jgi:predicted nucleic acid-binding protein